MRRAAEAHPHSDRAVVMTAAGRGSFKEMSKIIDAPRRGGPAGRALSPPHVRQPGGQLGGQRAIVLALLGGDVFGEIRLTRAALWRREEVGPSTAQDLFSREGATPSAVVVFALRVCQLKLKTIKHMTFVLCSVCTETCCPDRVTNFAELRGEPARSGCAVRAAVAGWVLGPSSYIEFLFEAVEDTRARDDRDEPLSLSGEVRLSGLGVDVALELSEAGVGEGIRIQ